MRLRELTAEGFRGFNENRRIEFSPGLTIIYGRNGTGKTSLGEALEWLFYGATTKRQKGDEISKREYKDTYRNLHFSGPGKPYVELSFQSRHGDDHVLRRVLNDDETSDVALDGATCQDLSQLGLSSPFDRPMILQHTLQDFIHMQPKNRYRALSAILGLESLMAFRADVDTLQGSGGYRRDRPRRAVEARTFFGEIAAEAKQYAEAKEFHVKLMESSSASLADVRSALRSLVVTATDRDVPDHQLIATLEVISKVPPVRA